MMPLQTDSMKTSSLAMIADDDDRRVTTTTVSPPNKNDEIITLTKKPLLTKTAAASELSIGTSTNPFTDTRQTTLPLSEVDSADSNNSSSGDSIGEDKISTTTTFDKAPAHSPAAFELYDVIGIANLSATTTEREKKQNDKIIVQSSNPLSKSHHHDTGTTK